MGNKKLNDTYKRKIYELVSYKTPEEIYQLVLDGTLSRFPRYFWSMPENYDWASKCTRYLIENVLKWNREDICEKFNIVIIRKYKLVGMASSLFNSNIFDILDNAYPNEFKPWELAMCSKGCFDDKDNVAKAVKWLIEEKLQWSRADVCKNLSRNTFKNNGLVRLINGGNGGVYDLLNLAYPNEYYSFELEMMQRNSWANIDNCNRTTRWLIEEKLKWGRSEVCEKFGNETMIENNLGGLLSRFNNSVYRVIDSAYPNEYMPWELRQCVAGLWEDESNIIKAIKWLVEDKLCYDKTKLNKITAEDFKNNGLGYLLRKKFGTSTKRALEFVYGKVE